MASITSSVIFESLEFTDEQIFKQLQSLDHQLLLQDHGKWLSALGPCVVTLAKRMSSAKTKPEALAALKVYCNENTQMDASTLKTITEFGDGILQGLRIVAESYLARSGRGNPSWGESTSETGAPEIVLKGSSGEYRPRKFLARGSAGLVYSASGNGRDGEFVLKRVYPTQYDSAVNEYKIATRLKDCKQCLSYLDCISTGEKEIWLVLPLIKRSEKYGVDLREYIVSGFFQEKGNQSHSRNIVMQLIEGLDQVSRKGVIMRDVKPDNVLVQWNDGTKMFEAFWTDFGLAVDLGEKYDGENLRKIRTTSANRETVRDDLVCWWYDTCKLVPRPKWNARRPPERGFTDPNTSDGTVHAFDSYMVGIILVSMALGIDLPHIDQPDAKAALEKFLGESLEKDYLKSFELFQCMSSTKDGKYVKAFQDAFGEKFGSAVCKVALVMLENDPIRRPKPSLCLAELKEAST